MNDYIFFTTPTQSDDTSINLIMISMTRRRKRYDPFDGLLADCVMQRRVQEYVKMLFQAEFFVLADAIGCKRYQ